jgi:hypothetical protein
MFPKDIDAYAQMVSSRNTSSKRRGFAVSSKQGGVPKIVRKTSNTSNVLKRRATFKPEQTEIKTGHQEKVFCCAGQEASEM